MELQIEEKATVFSKTGFSNWKKALDKEKGFPSHESSVSHITAMKTHGECIRRKNESQEISTLVNSKILEERRYYVTTVIEIIQLLATHRLPFRGTYNNEIAEEEGGVFMALYNYTLLKDSKFADAANHIPKNAIYTSGKIQNELIEMLAEAVRNAIVEEILSADVPQYTLFMDGTRNKNGDECISYGIRFVKDAEAFERIL